jgi:ATP-dependent exoDNAse (exonuclease V) beta subunit
MDRVVIDKDKVIVIDYKTGMDREAEDTYISQIKGYLKIMKEIYPDRTIEGKIVYIDLKRVMGVN